MHDILRSKIVCVSTLYLLAMLGLPAAHAASFDCDKAQTKNEHLICNDESLSAADDRLGALYREAMRVTHNKQQLIRDTRSAVRRRENSCTDGYTSNRDCIEAWYQEREKALIKVLHPDGSAHDYPNSTLISASAGNAFGTLSFYSPNHGKIISALCKSDECDWYDWPDGGEAKPIKNTIANITVRSVWDSDISGYIEQITKLRIIKPKTPVVPENEVLYE